MIDGIPAKDSVAKRIVLTYLLPFFAYSVKYIAVIIPIGADMPIESTTIYTVCTTVQYTVRDILVLLLHTSLN